MAPMELEGRVALVTGGARRVGRALSLALARAGASVVINFRESDQLAAALASEIGEEGGSAIAVRADVASSTDVTGLIAHAEAHFGRLDLVVNNASVLVSSPFEQITETEWDRVLDVNLKGPFLISQAAAPLLRKDGGGVIVNIADLSAFQTWPSYVHHAVSKAGLVHLTRQTARALAPEIRVNCIVPGTVLPADDASERNRESGSERVLTRRSGAPDDVSNAVLYFARNDFVTGAVLAVDGGRALL